MIDWGGLAANALWILGCALALAALSYASWQASVQKIPLKTQLRQAGAQAGLGVAGGLFSAGMAATARAVWQTVLWSALAVYFILQAAFALRRK